MPLILNIHTPAQSYALPYRENESSSALISRILRKSGLDKQAQETLKSASSSSGQSSGSLQYEYEGGRWLLSDDDDLEIMLSRFPASSTPSITLHLTPPPSSNSNSHSQSNGISNSLYSSPTASQPKTKKPKQTPTNPNLTTTTAPNQNGSSPTPTPNPTSSSLFVPSAPKSSMSTRTTSRPKSVHPNTGAISGYDDPSDPRVEGESMGDRHKRQWVAFREGRGVRTVQGSIGGVKDVRMLLKMGYRHVYVSRPFATRSGLIPKNSAMGTYGYAGLVNLGQLPITVGSKTAKHTVMISEETNFDVVLGRSWMEKMGIKTSPIDQTHVSYYDSDEVIPCDIVVLKDASGQVITVT